MTVQFRSGNKMGQGACPRVPLLKGVIFLSRRTRRRSANGIYHVMLRGINKQTIFEDDEDKLRLLETMSRFKGVSKFEVYSYCFMDNHIHLLLKETEESVSRVIQRISSSYVYWYNDKYERFGHLFQDRFKSENVETTDYFVRVLRYIHQNPMKAGIVSNVFESKWTSIHEYLKYPSLIDTDLALGLFSPHRRTAIQLFTDYMQEINDDQCLDDYVKKALNDSEVKKYMKELGISNSSILQQMEKNERDACIVELKKLNGVSIRQLSRVTGLSKNIIFRAYSD